MDNGAYGIRMDRSLKCDHLEDPSLGPLPPGYECFYSTGNIIRDNEVLGSGIADLSHDPLATGNSWQNNTCLTTEGAEIAPCNCPDSICGGSYRGWRLQLLRKSR